MDNLVKSVSLFTLILAT